VILKQEYNLRLKEFEAAKDTKCYITELTKAVWERSSVSLEYIGQFVRNFDDDSCLGESLDGGNAGRKVRSGT